MINKKMNKFKSSLNILVVDDSLMLQQTIRLILKSDFYNLGIALNGKIALEELEKNHYDLILMDLQMPEMDGFETTTRIRVKEMDTGEHIPILGMTGNHLENGRVICINAGMDDYLEKPFSIAELVEKIKRLTENKLHSNGYQ